MSYYADYGYMSKAAFDYNTKHYNPYKMKRKTIKKQKGGKFKGRNRQTSKQKGGFQMTHEELKQIIKRRKRQKKYNKTKKRQKGGGPLTELAAEVGIDFVRGYLNSGRKNRNSVPPPPPPPQLYPVPQQQYYYPPPPQDYQYR